MASCGPSGGGVQVCVYCAGNDTVSAHPMNELFLYPQIVSLRDMCSIYCSFNVSV